MSEFISFCFVFHVPHLIARLSRTIHPHIFSRLTGAQYTDCVTCLAKTRSVLVCTNYPSFTSSLTFLSLNMSLYVLFPMFHIFSLQHVPIGPAERPWTATQKCQPYYFDVQRATLAPIRLTAHIHVCPTLSH